MDLLKPILSHASRMPNQKALVFGDYTYTYKELNDEINRYSNGLIKQGLKKGDKVSLFLKNSHWFVICAYAVMKAGGVIVPINFRLTAKEIHYIVNQSDSIAVITDADQTELIKSAIADVSVNPLIYSTGDAAEGVISLKELDTTQTDDPNVPISADDDAQILYTSGTTGNPKGALLTHGNVISLNSAQTVMMKLNREDVYLLVAPAFHSAGLNMVLTSCFFAGATVVMMRDFHPLETLKAIEQHKVTLFFGVPAMYNAFFMIPKGSFDLSSVRGYIYGAAPMSPSMIESAVEYLGSDQFYNACGLTEGGPGGVYLTPEEHKTKLGASGKAMTFLDVRVVNDYMEDILPGEVGELIMRGESVMKEYYKKPEETAKTFRDGWLLTGDLATIDEEGFITLVDRKKDMIISGGENVYSVEVEQILNGYPGIVESAIIGLPDLKWGEVVTAVIVKKDDIEIDEEDIKAYCREHLAGYKLPRNFIYVEALPRNVSGKILKYQLRENWKEDKISQ
ncbi:long-chain-fatty-acid--CoA ligase [Solibacillus sp. A46]|uniref:Long-chain-fatty-acid--CoA ligase n=1 Tax=Solibacillus faecavium TaxID=2762221 RepID=A0ABR8Y2N7_9BACL|nr:long-chain-fatty-acid--CoA ligase [Solibacillus faecavium]MBD8038482.1 long-chain-fatty-acid--CoA ligase [Solibacillus faecavium]